MPKKPSLTLLGKNVPAPQTPGQAVLEKVANPHPDTDYMARFTCPEFTSLCPMTGQPDYAYLMIDYVPGKWIVESPSITSSITSHRSRVRPP